MAKTADFAPAAAQLESGDDLIALLQPATAEELPPRGGGGGGQRESKWRDFVTYFLSSNEPIMRIQANPDAVEGDGTMSVSAIRGGVGAVLRAHNKAHGISKGVNKELRLPISVRVNNATGEVFLVNTDLHQGAQPGTDATDDEVEE